MDRAWELVCFAMHCEGGGLRKGDTSIGAVRVLLVAQLGTGDGTVSSRRLEGLVLVSAFVGKPNNGTSSSSNNNRIKSYHDHPPPLLWCFQHCLSSRDHTRNPTPDMATLFMLRLAEHS